MAAPSSSTVPISFVHHLLAGTAIEPPRRTALVQQAGIAPALLTADTARVTTEQFATLYRLLARELDDELPGMFSRPVRAGAFKFLCLSLLESANLQTALFRFTRFFHLLLDDFAIDLSRQGGLVRIALIPQTPAAPANTFGQEIMLKLIHGVASWLTGHKMTLARVDCAYPRPRHASEYVFSIRGRCISTRGSRPCTSRPAPWPHRSGRTRTPSAPSSARRRAAGSSFPLPSAWSARRCGRPWKATERSLSIETVARSLHTSVRSLTRHLATEGTTFQAIKDELRRDVAIQCLTQTDMPIAVIGTAVGFDDPTTFHRAFRKWTGSTPGAYRLRR